MASFVENILFGNQYIGIEIFTRNNEDRFSFLQVEKKKNELAISKEEIFDDITAFEARKAKIPAALIINTAQVLQKEVLGADTNDRKLIHKAFPNIKTEDFYYGIWRKGTVSLIAVCRKNYVDNLVNSLEKNFRIAAISLGVTAISKITNFTTQDAITTNSQLVNIHNDDIILAHSPITTPAIYEINGLEISNSYLLSFCGILRLLLRDDITTGSINQLEAVKSEAYKQNTFFEKGVKIGLGFILSLLLVNFFLFSYFFDKSSQMDEKVAFYKVEIDQISKLKERIKDKEQKLYNFTNTTSKSSLLLNELVKDMPSYILLSELSYHPLEKKVKENEPIMSRDSIITVSGNILDNRAFTGWIKEIEKQDWIGNVTITSFGKSEDHITAFSIEITINK